MCGPDYLNNIQKKYTLLLVAFHNKALKDQPASHNYKNKDVWQFHANTNGTFSTSFLHILDICKNGKCCAF